MRTRELWGGPGDIPGRELDFGGSGGQPVWQTPAERSKARILNIIAGTSLVVPQLHLNEREGSGDGGSSAEADNVGRWASGSLWVSLSDHFNLLK